MRTIAALCAALLLTACGGGGSVGVPLVTNPAVPAPGPSAAVATFTIQIPASGASASARRHVRYVSAATQSIAIATNGGAPFIANLTATSPGCVAAPATGAVTCTLAVPAIVGTDTFNLTLYDAVGATGNILSTATVHQTIGSGRTNTIHVTLNGVVHSLALTIATPNPPIGTAATIALSVTALDADGNIIIAPGNYVNAADGSTPIALSDSDKSGVTKLTSTKLTSSSSTAPALTYSGAALANGATITAAATGVASVASVTAVFKPQATTAHYSGTLASGATYVVDVPANWNGELLLYSHGYDSPGSPNPATDAPDSYLNGWWLAHGYALAGSSYATTGYAVNDALSDQLALLDLLPTTLGVNPKRTIAMGDSMGGLISAALIEANPTTFAGALPMCGNLAGSVAEWNQMGDFGFVLATLLDPNATLSLTNITSPAANLQAAQAIVTTAQTTPAGQARLALAAALGWMPDWYDTPNPPVSGAVGTLEQQAIDWLNFDLWFEFDGRAELESRAGGDPYDNTSVDYAQNFAAAPISSDVLAMYQNAGLDINADLAALNAANRISANPAALAFVTQYVTPAGSISIPVLTLHTTTDGLVPAAHENAYSAAVDAQGNGALLQEVFVQRPGHCNFTDAEVIAAFLTLDARINGGTWPATTAAAMNALAATYGSSAFIDFAPPPYIPTRTPAAVKRARGAARGPRSHPSRPG